MVGIFGQSLYFLRKYGTPAEKVGAPVGNPTIVAGIDPIHRTIMPKVPIFPEISDETPNFPGNLAI